MSWKEKTIFFLEKKTIEFFDSKDLYKSHSLLEKFTNDFVEYRTLVLVPRVIEITFIRSEHMKEFDFMLLSSRWLGHARQADKPLNQQSIFEPKIRRDFYDCLENFHFHLFQYWSTEQWNPFRR